MVGVTERERVAFITAGGVATADATLLLLLIQLLQLLLLLISLVPCTPTIFAP